MNTVTYSQDAVVDFLAEHFIPVRSLCDFTHFTALMRRYQVKWTPTFLVLDPDGREHHRIVGFLPPEDFMAQLQLGKAKLYYDQDRLDKAASELQAVSDRFPKTAATEEAVFLTGVANYKRSHQAGELRKAWDRLSREYPQSEWTRKAKVYSTL
jgi:thioredoxin-related protein